jgi:ATP-dependent DNA ligase
VNTGGHFRYRSAHAGGKAFAPLAPHWNSKGIGDPVRGLAEDQARELSLRELAGEETRPLGPRHHPGITPAVMKRWHWVEPLLVAQVKLTEWTSDDQLRQPVFLGLRTDKQPKEVVRE